MIFRLCSSDSQQISLDKVLSETSFVAPVAIRAASLCILFRSFFSYSVQLSHITSPYSSRGLINAV